MPYAAYAYRVYPGPVSAQAKLATAGFSVDVRPSGGHEVLSVGAASFGQPPQTKVLPPGDQVYFVEAAFGDDSGNSDYSAGDDGVVVTNSTGHLVS